MHYIFLRLLRIKRIRIIVITMIWFSLYPAYGYCSDLSGKTVVIKNLPPRNANDRRADFPMKLLRMILDITVDEYGPYQLKPGSPMTQDRIIAELEKGRLDVSQLPISEKANQRLLPVRIPIRKGMLGWRILLIRKEDRKKFAAVKTIDDLRKFRAGFGSQWGDLNILEKNVGEVITSNEYEALFEMLIAERFDYLHRGLHEPWHEVAARKEKYPGLYIEETLVLHYPIGDFFYVSKHNLILAERIESGFKKIISDGSFENIFNKEYTETIKRANIPQRNRIDFGNPFLPADTPLNVKEYWLDFK